MIHPFAWSSRNELLSIVSEQKGIFSVFSPSSGLRRLALDIVTMEAVIRARELIYFNARFRATTPDEFWSDLQLNAGYFPRESSKKAVIESKDAHENTCILIDNAHDLIALNRYLGSKNLLDTIKNSSENAHHVWIFFWQSHSLCPDILKGTSIFLKPLIPREVILAAERYHRELTPQMAEYLISLTGGFLEYIDWLLLDNACISPRSLDHFIDRELLKPDSKGYLLCQTRFIEILEQSRGFAALKAVLKTLSLHPDTRLSEIASHLKMSPPAVQDYLEILVKTGAVARNRWTYSLIDRMLQRFLQIQTDNISSASMNLPIKSLQEQKYWRGIPRKELEID